MEIARRSLIGTRTWCARSGADTLNPTVPIWCIPVGDEAGTFRQGKHARRQDLWAEHDEFEAMGPAEASSRDSGIDQCTGHDGIVPVDGLTRTSRQLQESEQQRNGKRRGQGGAREGRTG